MPPNPVPVSTVCAFIQAAIRAAPGPANIKAAAVQQVNYACATMKMTYTNSNEGQCEGGAHPCVSGFAM